MNKQQHAGYLGWVGIMLIAGVLWGCAPQESGLVEQVPAAEMTSPGVANVTTISTQALVGKTRITIEADRELTYTAFKLTDPLRLVLDLPNVNTSEVTGKTISAQTPILRVTPFQFADGGRVNSRIEVALAQLIPYQVLSDGNKLFIDLETGGTGIETASVSQPATALPPGFEELTPATPQTPIVIAAQPEPGSAGVPSVPPGTPTIQIAPPPQTVGQVTTLSQVLAVPGATAVIKNLELTEVNGKTRIILSADTTPAFEVTRSELPPRLTIDLKQSDLPPGMEKTLTPESLQSLVKQVRLFQLRRTPDGADNVARILVDLMQPTKHEVSTEPGTLIVDLLNPAIRLTDPAMQDGQTIQVPLTAGIEDALKSGGLGETPETATAPTIRSPKTGEEKEYKGQLISIHFQNANILDVLDVIAEVSGLNLVVHPGVSGTVTVRLDNIPWDQALDIVLKMNNLAVEIEGNILRVAAATVFQQEVAQRVQQQRQQIEARRVQEELEPLDTKLITVNFTDPGSIVALINQYFSGATAGQQQQQRRGTITVDSRTKTLIVQDTSANIKKIEEIVATLDRRTPQVMIEARIVSISTTIRKELGISWNGRFRASPATGNPLGYRFPYTADIPFGVSLPPVTGVGYVGGMTFGSIDDILSVFARIDAAEMNNEAKSLGQPKVFTQDNVPAAVNSTLTQWVSVAGDSQTAATLQAIPVTLSLSVTPRISQDGFITMTVTVSNGNLERGGAQPITSTQGLNSVITVKDSETAVIGGIYQTEESKNFQGVPFLHKIPVLGWLFKSTNPNSNRQTELLVFLTPRILDRSILKPENDGMNASFSY